MARYAPDGHAAGTGLSAGAEVASVETGVGLAVIAGGLDGVAVGAGVALHPASRAGTASSMASGRRTNGMPGAYLRSSPSTCCPVG